MMYFFDTIDFGSVFRDDYGLDLPDSVEMRRQAVLLLHDLMQDDVQACEARRIDCDVRDGDGRIVYRASLALSAELP